MIYTSMLPLSEEITNKRAITGCGVEEARKELLRSNLLNWLERPNANYSRHDLQQVLIAILKERL